MDGVSGLRRLYKIPSGLLGAQAGDLHGLLGGPTVLELAGRGAPVFVAVLLHGNETSGWLAIRDVLGGHDERTSWPLVVLIGNTGSAAKNLRRMPHGPEHNRIWHPDAGGIGAEYWSLRDELAGRGLAAAIDVHNNNALNPCHALCMSRAGDVDATAWAHGFSGVVIRSTLSMGTCMEAFAGLCPSVTLECGEPGDGDGVRLATRYINEALAGKVPVWEGKSRSYSLAARVTVREGVSIGFGKDEADLVLPDGAPSRWNFQLLRKGAEFARIGNGTQEPLRVAKVSGSPVDDYFGIRGEWLVAARDLVPAMLADKREVIEDDCLCYFLEPEGQAA